MKYDLKDIITFTYVAKLGSFARAADVLGIAKSAPSTRIAELEKAIGMSLFTRTTREVNLTTDGAIFLKYCAQVLEKVENIDYFLQKREEIYGTLRIAIPPYFSRNHIVPHLKEFTAKYPKLTLDIFLTENNINIVTECFDLQIRIQKPEEEDLEVAKLDTNHKVICASPEYLEKFGIPQYPQDLLSHNCIVFGENSIWKFRHKNTNELIELHDMTGNIKCNNGEIIKELILHGNGITVKSSKDIQEELQNGKIIQLLPDYEVLNETEFYAVYPFRKYISPKTKAFIEFFQEKFAI
jgi:DNA-binding transcriptional LysR family regulator